MSVCVRVRVCVFYIMYINNFNDNITLHITGGAAEMMLTGGIITNVNDRHSEWYMLTGYLFLFSNSFCTVR